jgi:hypothetical protein
MHPRRTALLAVVVVVLAFLTIRSFRARSREAADAERPYRKLGTSPQKNAADTETQTGRGPGGGARTAIEPRHRDGGRSPLGVGIQE